MPVLITLRQAGKRVTKATIGKTQPRTWKADPWLDEYETLETDPVGDNWLLELYEAGDTPGVDTPIESTYFSVGYNAEITALSATDAATVGSSTQVDCSVQNDNSSSCRLRASITRGLAKPTWWTLLPWKSMTCRPWLSIR